MPDPSSSQPRTMDAPVRPPASPLSSEGHHCRPCGEAQWESAQSLAAFLALHVKAYDPDTDDYDRPPFASDIKEGKNDPIYNAHSYHTKVPPRSIIPYILHYTQPGDVVLDPFCGSGMTGVAAQMCANPPADILEQFPELKERVGPRACILNDLSPAACHIAYNYNTPVDVDALRREFERIKAAVKEEFDWLYSTEHYEPAVALYSPKSPDVLARLKNPPHGAATARLLDSAERTWELLTLAEVESRLGYPVTDLPRDSEWGELDVAQVAEWVSIPATIQYTIWSDVYRCEGFVTVEEPTGKISRRGKNAGKPIIRKKKVSRGCNSEFALWDVAVDLNAGKVAESFKCPHCDQDWEKSQLARTRVMPMLTNLSFVAIGKRGPRTRRILRRVSAAERRLVDQIDRRPIPYWFPTEELHPGRDMYVLCALHLRGIRTSADFYSRRNLWSLAALWHHGSLTVDARTRAAIFFVITAFLSKYATRLFNVGVKRGQINLAGQLPNTLYPPSIYAERNYQILAEAKFADLVPAFRNHDGLTTPVVTRIGSATDLTGIPPHSIDYVFMDPPFGSNIFYGDCSFLWESWLGRSTDLANEAVISRSVRSNPFPKSQADYGRLMREAFGEVFRVLKPNKACTVEFNNSDGEIFELIKSAARHAGFVIENMGFLDKVQRTFKGFKGESGAEDVVGHDVIFNLRKPAKGEQTARTSDSEDGAESIEHLVADTIREHLRTLPDRIRQDPRTYGDEHRSTAFLNTMLMNTLIPRGVGVEQLNLPFIERVCARYFRKVGQYWYLRGQAVGNGTNQDGLFEEEVQVRDEVTAIEWLRQKLHAAPMLVGELKPFWMRATGLLPAAVSQALSLEDLLAENFWRDLDTNRWREPTDEERERMNDDRSIRVLHDAERYVAGSLRRSTTDAERSDWIDVLFKACREVEDNEARSTPALRGFDCGEGYRLMARLFQTILKEHVPSADFTRAQKQAAAASKRITQDVREEDIRRQADAGKKRGPTLFDLEDVT